MQDGLASPDLIQQGLKAKTVTRRNEEYPSSIPRGPELQAGQSLFLKQVDLVDDLDLLPLRQFRGKKSQFRIEQGKAGPGIGLVQVFSAEDVNEKARAFKMP